VQFTRVTLRETQLAGVPEYKYLWGWGRGTDVEEEVNVRMEERKCLVQT
jgi:hypothetical protein